MYDGSANENNSAEVVWMQHDDKATENVLQIEAKVAHCLQVIASHREADCHVHDSVLQHEHEHIACLPQSLQIVQEHWLQLYDIDEHKQLQNAIIEELDCM